MTNDAVRKLAQEYIDDGVDPETAMALAVATLTKRSLAEEESGKTHEAELEKVIKDGREVIRDLQQVHRALTEE